MRIGTLLVAFLALTGISVRAEAQKISNGSENGGAWFRIGGGFESVGCGECGARGTSPFLSAAIGGRPSDHLKIGAALSYTTDGGDFIGSGGVWLYPKVDGGFFFRGGLGYYGNSSDSGPVAVLGLGGDVRLGGSSSSLTPFIDLVLARASSDYGHLNWNAVQIGVAFSIR